MKLLKAFTFVVGSNWEYWIVLVLVILSSVQSFFPCFKLSCFIFMLDFVILAFVIFKFFLVFAFEPTYDGSHFPLRAENRIAIVRVGIALSFPFFSLRHCSMATKSWHFMLQEGVMIRLGKFIGHIRLTNCTKSVKCPSCINWDLYGVVNTIDSILSFELINKKHLMK